MKRWIRDLFLPVAVVLALPIGMLGPALTLPALVYGFPVFLLGVLVGFVVLALRERRREPGAPKEARAQAPPPAARRESFTLAASEPLAGGPFHRILLLLDPEDHAPEALARAVATARRDGADLVLVSVMEYERAIRRGAERQNAHHHPAAVRARLDKELENLCWRLEEHGVQARRRVELENPALRVPELARQEQADLVVVAPPRQRLRLLRTRTRTPDWARVSPCPVLALSA